MATPATSGGMSPTPRWSRSGEPGSAFSGLSRTGRGRGRGAARAGRGGNRGGASAKDSKPDDEPYQANTKTDSLQVPSTAASKPPGSSFFSASPSIPGKSIPPSPTSKPAKPSSRRASRTIPPSVTTQIQAAEVVAPPASAKAPNRRRRSQTGKPGAVIPPKINPPAPNDNLLRPNKPRLGPVPHTAPVKDTPPHMNQKPGMRNDIDALVERVRAVAMDHRPTTPGSHIDWAGDDDDSLPDLDDWGVTPATFNANKLDAISPIIVDGLRPLPDIASHSIPNSPLKQVQNMAISQESPTKPEQKEKDSVSSSGNANIDSHPNEKEPEKPANNIPKVVEPVAKEKPISPVISKAPHTNTSHSTSRRPIHPSLPAKPVVGTSYISPKSRAGAAPMRNSPYPRSPINSTSSDKGSDTKSDPSQTAAPEAQAVNEKESSIAPKQPAANDDQTNKSEASETLKKAEPKISGEPDQHKPATTTESPNKSDKQEREGLAASIHAPKAMTDSVSAPANISTYADLPSNSLHGFTHTRAHTVGRPPSFPKAAHGHGEYVPRFSRSGHSTPRGGGGGFHESYHSRTHSSPPAGAMANQLRTPPSSRPVITGDAISRLARTIGKSSGGPASKPPPVAPTGE